MAGAALFPQAAVRSVGAVRDISDSSLIMRLTRGRGWIAVLSALLLGIVALNVISLSLNAGSGRLSLQIDELKTEISSLQAQIDERLSASRVEQGASHLGLAVPDPKSITYLNAGDGSAQHLLQLLESNSFATAPSLPSSYPPPGTSYAPVRTSTTGTTGTAGTTTSGSQTPMTQTTTAPPSTPSAPPSGSAGGGATQGASGGSTGGVGL